MKNILTVTEDYVQDHEYSFELQVNEKVIEKALKLNLEEAEKFISEITRRYNLNDSNTALIYHNYSGGLYKDTIKETPFSELV